jgi:hypothetical protein
MQNVWKETNPNAKLFIILSGITLRNRSLKYEFHVRVQNVFLLDFVSCMYQQQSDNILWASIYPGWNIWDFLGKKSKQE